MLTKDIIISNPLQQTNDAPINNQSGNKRNYTIGRETEDENKLIVKDIILSSLQEEQLEIKGQTTQIYESDDESRNLKRSRNFSKAVNDTVFQSKEVADSNAHHVTHFNGIISQSIKMFKVFSTMQKVAKTGSTVMILGESGTGKELIAKALHKMSERSGRLVPVNCGAIPEELLESELFGHEKGSFTGATSTRTGRFLLADKGTIFLDEIGEMSPKLQVKLLRVLQEKVIDPVGSNRSIEVNVRVIAATHKDLREEVRKGRFREDLYYRLQVISLEVPPLRERDYDCLILTQKFLERECRIHNKPTMTLSSAVKEAFRTYHWSGNVRELENLIQSLAILVDEKEVQMEHLPEHIRKNISSSFAQNDCHQEEIAGFSENGIDFNLLVDKYETQLILTALKKTDWNKKAAAKLLNINRTTLVEKIKKKQLETMESERDQVSDREFLLESN
jgi:transcriptional regulator with GAF, ATPase, and Fis domain